METEASSKVNWRHLLMAMIVLSTVVLLVGVTANSAPGYASATPNSAAYRSAAPHAPLTIWNIGDVFVGLATSPGTNDYRSYEVWDPANSGGPKETLTDTYNGGTHAGCAFDSAYNLYTTSFSHDSVIEYDGNTHVIVQPTIDTFVDIGHANPESIVFDNSGNFYVGKAGETGNSTYGVVLKFNSAGTRQGSYNVAVSAGERGADWIDLAPDQHTLFYTSEGTTIHRYDLSTGTQLGDFAVISGAGTIWALRILPYGDANHYLLVATDTDIELLNSAGAVVQRYTAPGDNGWFSLNLDPDGIHFWSADQSPSRHLFYRWNVYDASGQPDLGPYDAGWEISGLCLKGEITAGNPPPTATPGGAQPTPTPTRLPQTTPTPSSGCNVQFSDVQPGDTFYPYIHCLACLGIIGGYNDGTFRPGNNITRGQISKMVSNAAQFNDAVPSDQQTYTDVPYSNPFWLWIERLTMHNVMSGYSCGGPDEPCDAQNRPYFRWGNNATRGQLSKIVSNAANIQDPVPSNQQTFEDVPYSNPFWLWIERLAKRGVMGGYTCGTPPAGQCVPPGNRAYFLPFNNVTRGQASKIVANTFFPNCQLR